MSKIRIVNDIIEFNKNDFKNIKIYFDKNNFTEVYALIFGPKNTPYFGGNFFFKINFPDDYPKQPPNVKYLTTDGKIRFHPNLYGNGKVCLSIINTWPGPKWIESMTLTSILLSIESLLTERPLIHEPGYAHVKSDNLTSISYNIYVHYYTYSFAITKIVSKKFKPLAEIDLVEIFYKDILKNLEENYVDLNNNLLSLRIIYGNYPYQFKAYSTTVSQLNFDSLFTKFKDITGEKVFK
jgi:ubiquitin-conjugating enzyme E2 Z